MPDDYFSFKTMVSSVLIKYIYAFGLIVITITGIFLIVEGGRSLWIGIGWITFGNLIWRIVCEAFIIIFSIHDVLVSIESELKHKGSSSKDNGLNAQETQEQIEKLKQKAAFVPWDTAKSRELRSEIERLETLQKMQKE